MNKKNKIILSSIILVLSLIFVYITFFNKSNEDLVKSILEQNNVGQIKYSIKYDTNTKTLMLDGDLVDKNGRDDDDYNNLVKSIPSLFKQDLVHQFEYKQDSSVDRAGAINLNLKVIASTGFKFSNEIFYSWKWNKNDVGICSRNIKVIPQFAHITKQSAAEIEVMLKVKQCRLWNNVKHYKKLW